MTPTTMSEAVAQIDALTRQLSEAHAEIELLRAERDTWRAEASR